ncbi:hypothetical protein [Ferruginibacter profundus]
MKYILTIYLSAISYILLAQSGELNCSKNSYFEFVGNASIVKYPVSAVDTGRNIVFRLSKEYDCTSDIFDDEILVRAVWEIPENTSSYNIHISAKDSSNIPFIYLLREGPNIREFLISAEGYINCKLIGDIWKIEADLNIAVYNSSTKITSKKKLNFQESFSKWKGGSGKRKFGSFKI